MRHLSRRRFWIFLLLLTLTLFSNTPSAGIKDVMASIPDTSGMPGDTVVIPINVSNVTKLGIIGMDITLTFNSNILTADSASFGSVVPTEGLRLIKSNPRAGQITIAMACAYPLRGNGNLVTVPFVVLKTARYADTCTIHFGRCWFNEKTVSVRDGLFTVKKTLIVKAIIHIYPEVLNLKNRRECITCCIKLPDGHDAKNIDVSAILLNGKVPVNVENAKIGDYDDDGIPELMVKFDAAKVLTLLSPANEVELTVTGKALGIPFRGTDTIKVVTKGTGSVKRKEIKK